MSCQSCRQALLSVALVLFLWTVSVASAVPHTRLLLDTTRTGDKLPCSLLVNAAVAERSNGILTEMHDSIEDGSMALTMFALGSGLKGTVTHYPIAAVVGGSELVTGVQDDSIMLSPAVGVGSEICFIAVADGPVDDILEAQCVPACAKMQNEFVSVSYHNTSLGSLPFVFVGEKQQDWAKCGDIMYPEQRTPLGWRCAPQDAKSAGIRFALSAGMLVAPVVLLLLQL